MKTLKQFYRELQAWIDDGCHEHDVFEADKALCTTLLIWSGHDDDVSWEITRSFIEKGLDQDHPFNNSMRDFVREANNASFYKNPARLQWIKEHAS